VGVLSSVRVDGLVVVSPGRDGVHGQVELILLYMREGGREGGRGGEISKYTKEKHNIHLIYPSPPLLRTSQRNSKRDLLNASSHSCAQGCCFARSAACAAIL